MNDPVNPLPMFLGALALLLVLLFFCRVMFEEPSREWAVPTADEARKASEGPDRRVRAGKIASQKKSLAYAIRYGYFAWVFEELEPELQKELIEKGYQVETDRRGTHPFKVSWSTNNPTTNSTETHDTDRTGNPPRD